MNTQNLIIFVTMGQSSPSSFLTLAPFIYDYTSFFAKSIKPLVDQGFSRVMLHTPAGQRNPVGIMEFDQLLALPDAKKTELLNQIKNLVATGIEVIVYIGSPMSLDWTLSRSARYATVMASTLPFLDAGANLGIDMVLARTTAGAPDVPTTYKWFDEVVIPVMKEAAARKKKVYLEPLDAITYVPGYKFTGTNYGGGITTAAEFDNPAWRPKLGLGDNIVVMGSLPIILQEKDGTSTRDNSWRWVGECQRAGFVPGVAVPSANQSAAQSFLNVNFIKQSIAPVPASYNYPTPLLVGDLNHDGTVNTIDYSILISDFGKSDKPGYAGGDLNSDGTVNTADLGIMNQNMGKKA